MVSATSLKSNIAWLISIHRQNHRQLAATFSFSGVAGHGQNIRRLESAFFILVESGALLCLCQVCQMPTGNVLRIPRSDSS